jgi:hypothetical protein
MLLLVVMLGLKKDFSGLDHILHALFSQRAVVEGGQRSFRERPRANLAVMLRDPAEATGMFLLGNAGTGTVSQPVPFLFAVVAGVACLGVAHVFSPGQGFPLGTIPGEVSELLAELAEPGEVHGLAIGGLRECLQPSADLSGFGGVDLKPGHTGLSDRGGRGSLRRQQHHRHLADSEGVGVDVISIGGGVSGLISHGSGFSISS